MLIDESEVAAAIEVVRAGGVIAYPTEAVWGLGSDPWNAGAVRKILKLKKRPEEKGLILVAARIEQIKPLLANLSPAQRALLEDSWPGPVTWLIPDPDQWIPAWIKGQFDTVAIRVSDHSGVQALCNAFGGLLVSTSANPATEEPALSRAKVEEYFPDNLDRIVEGELGQQSRPSTIKDLRSSALIRQ